MADGCGRTAGPTAHEGRANDDRANDDRANNDRASPVVL
jgi:hypothetical protein